MLTIKKISMRNFFSFGNAPQVLELDTTDLTLVLGQNNDVSTEGAENGGRRNGVGKSAIIQGIVFGLYGKSIGNDIKIPNLVNKTNTKHCEVIVDFIKDGIEYRIERGRNPTYFNFYSLEGNVQDESRGEKKDTQEDLNEILGISQLLFEHIVVLNANVEPFLSLSQQKQRDMIEELLGITQLTEKAELLKDMYKDSKREAEQEKFKIETISASNKRIEQSIETLQLQGNKFESDKKSKIELLTKELSNFIDLDFNSLYEDAKNKEFTLEHNNKRSLLENRVNNLAVKREQYQIQIETNKNQLNEELANLSKIDIALELQNHEELQTWNELKQIITHNTSTKNYKERELTSLKISETRIRKNIADEMAKLQTVLDSKCPLCESKLNHNDTHTEMKDKIQASIDALEIELHTCTDKISTISNEISEIEIFDMPEKPTCIYNSISEAKLHEHKINELNTILSKDDINIYDDELISTFTELESMQLMDVPDTFNTAEVKELEVAYNAIQNDLTREMNSVNTYFQQIDTLKSTSIQHVDYDRYNELDKLASHQDFMVKLLLNKDSYVRKRIIEQNISFLNSRLSFYIEKCGSQHIVQFMNDLSVDISLNDQSYDFKQLSRGERTRVIISLNLAFRDTYESLYQGINVMLVDELLDNGLDTGGIESAWHTLQDLSAIHGKNIFVVSHREELVARANNILKVVKEDGFSTVEYCDIMDI